MVGEETGGLDTVEEHLYPEDYVDNLESEARITEEVFGLNSCSASGSTGVTESSCITSEVLQVWFQTTVIKGISQ